MCVTPSELQAAVLWTGGWCLHVMPTVHVNLCILCTHISKHYLCRIFFVLIHLLHWCTFRFDWSLAYRNSSEQKVWTVNLRICEFFGVVNEIDLIYLEIFVVFSEIFDLIYIVFNRSAWLIELNFITIFFIIFNLVT